MSKNFEKEYKEYLNAQAPDLWDRIEAGVDTLGTDVLSTEEAGGYDEQKVVPISDRKSKKSKKKRKIRYQHYRMIVSVAACLFALILIVPVYLLTRPAEKNSSAADSAPQVLEDVTIQNLVVNSEKSETAAEESAPMEDVSTDVTEIEIAPEESAEETVELAQVTETNDAGTGDEETVVAGAGENGGQIAEAEISLEEDAITDMLQEEATSEQEDISVTILGEGVAQEGGMMYTAAETGDASSSTIDLFVPEGSYNLLEMGKTYTLTVQKSQDGSHYVVLAVAE